MDVSLEVIVGAALLVVILLIGITIFTDQSTKLDEVFDNRNDQSQCTLDKINFEQACNCPTDSPPPKDDDKTTKIKQRAQDNGCSWVEGGYSCTDACS